ncbi:MAG: dephospho-CoA kinase [Spirochaetota bacterium]|jgi:dephospho-CoA kinase|nr:dephospho-CoA kinase [Spirochaetota bacterium]
MKKEYVLGITGGMAGGKSEAASRLRRHFGMDEIDVDRVGHGILPAMRGALLSAFGDAILDAEGQVSRPALARIVFASDEALARLEAILHPPMRDEVARILAAIPNNCVVVNAALLYRMRLDALCGTVVYIDAPREICIARALAKGGRTREDIEKMLSRQEDINTGRSYADVVIGNAASLADFYDALDGFAQNFIRSQANGDAANLRAPDRQKEGTLYPEP